MSGSRRAFVVVDSRLKEFSREVDACRISPINENRCHPCDQWYGLSLQIRLHPRKSAIESFFAPFASFAVNLVSRSISENPCDPRNQR
jgi:hypothetical protein